MGVMEKRFLAGEFLMLDEVIDGTKTPLISTQMNNFMNVSMFVIKYLILFC
jgi:hypothetical protein